MLVVSGLFCWLEVNRVLDGLFGVPGIRVFSLSARLGVKKTDGERDVELLDEAPVTGEPEVRLIFAEQLPDDLTRLRESKQVEAMRDTVLVRNPMFDGFVNLSAETIEGERPRRRGQGCELGQMVLLNGGDDRRFAIEAGWPFQRYLDDWMSRVRNTLHDYHEQLKKHLLRCAPMRSKASPYRRVVTSPIFVATCGNVSLILPL